MASLTRLRRATVITVAGLLIGGLSAAPAFAKSAHGTHGKSPHGGATATSGAPTYTNYPSPTGMADDAGEPSIGADWKTGAAMFQAGLQTLRVTFDTSTTPAKASWADVSAPNAITSLDPILFTDSSLGRTYASQLLAACSLMSVTPDDGATWTPSQGCGVGTLLDHQTVGGGPYNTSLLPAPPTAPGAHAVYYCAQYVLAANCARSDDGGMTFGAGTPIYNALTDGCAGLHGHLKVAPDGTVYVPNFDCNGQQAVTVSEDNGVTWQVRPVPGATTQDESDPSLGIANDGTLYFGFASNEGSGLTGDSHPKIAVSHDKGLTWSTPFDVGTAFGIKNVQFPEVVAGDGNRAAYAFLGTPTGGDDQMPRATGDPMFQGVWHLYIATTYDGGSTWTTVDATPTDPVQKGCIWLQGGSSPGNCRNLLDFNDATMDAQGRVLVAYADGCLASDCPADSSPRPSKGVIVRQTTGLGLLSAFDGQL